MNITERTTVTLAWIDARIELCNAATKGPWATDGQQIEGDGQGVARSGWTVRRKENAAFIAAARTGYPAALLALKDAILAVREIHELGFYHTEKAMNFILTKIESLQ